MQRMKKDKTLLLNILADKRDIIEQYIKVNNLSCKSIAGIQKIVDYYNSLQ